jgi:ribonuclease-3 family protein
MLQKELPSVAALAFLGDAVHTCFVREKLVAHGISHAKELNSQALSYVTATAQAEAFARIRESLNEAEADVWRRAYNTSHINRPKNVSGETYRTATGFEAVLGMLAHLGDTQRLTELLTSAYQETPLLA